VLCFGFRFPSTLLSFGLSFGSTFGGFDVLDLLASFPSVVANVEQNK